MKTPHLKMLLFGVIVASLGVVGNAHAGTIFSNLGPANSYDSANAWAVYGAGVSPCCGVSQAMPFVPVGDWVLTQIDVALEHGFGTNSAVLTLNSDNSGSPGGVLASWSLSGMPPLGACCAVETVTPSSAILLGSGIRYWLVASPGASDTGLSWAWNNTGSTGVSLQTNNLGNWSQNPLSTLSAFDVQGDPTPEPASIVLYSIGILAIGGLRMLKARGKRR